MPANTAPIFTLTPNVASVKIATTSAVAQNDGASTGATTNLLYQVLKAGANGSFVQKVRFNPVASAANVTSVATVLRVYISTVNTGGANAAVGATTNANTFLIAEISVPAIAAANSTNAATYFDVTLNFPLASGQYILVGQHVAQTTNQQWQATAIGGDY